MFLNGFDSLAALAGGLFTWAGLHCLGRIRRELDMTATKEDVMLRDDEGGDVVLVEVEVFVGYGAVGVDRGVLGFADEAVFFSGHSFSFQIGSQDLERRWGIWQAVTVPGAQTVGLRHPTQRVTLEIRPLSGRYRSSEYARFLLASGLNLLRGQPPTSVQRQYPPLEPWADRERL
jgi:hypothetical protein